MKVFANSSHSLLHFLLSLNVGRQNSVRQPTFQVLDCHTWDGVRARENRWDGAILRTEIRV